MVAVVVTRDAPAERLDQVLRALAAQDYPNLDVLVVDAGTSDVAERVRAVLPAALVRRTEGAAGSGAAANTVLDAVMGATAYVFCHDDACPEPGAVSALVAASERWEADIVGPKLLRWDDPRRFAQFGLTVDKVGESLPYVLPGELDQGQHDGLRDVFAVPGGFTLVRAERFAQIGGFDEEISGVGDDLSLSWRARVAGARVLVTSAAAVRHAEACTRPGDESAAAGTAARHRVRVLLTSYSGRSLVTVVPQALALSAVEAARGLAGGSLARARAALGAWPWNLRRLSSLQAARRHVASFRTVSDREVRRYQVQGLVGPRLTLRRLGADGPGDAPGDGAGPGDDAGADPGTTGGGRRSPRAAAVPVRGHMDVDPAAWSPAAVAVAVCVAAVVAFGSRHLLTRGIPVVGELVPAGGSAGDLLAAWWGGWRPVGMGAEGATPALAGALGLLATVLGGHVGLARTVLMVGLVPLGILGAHRMAAPTGSKRAQVAAAVAYAAVPLPYDALAAGRWSALAAWSAAPWMLGRLARASGAAPYDRTGGPRSLVRHAVLTGVVTALAGTLVPPAPALLVGMALGLAVGSLLAGEVRGLGRLLAAGAGGAAVSLLLLLPTTVGLMSNPGGLDAWRGPDRPAAGLRALDLLGLRTGSTLLVGLAILVPVAAAVPLLVGRRWRLAWAIRAWTVALAAWALVWAHQQGWVSVRLPEAGIMLAPAAAGLALAVGLGMAAVEHDVRGRSWRFGLRRLAVGIGVLALVGATASPVVASLDGRWGMPPDDFAGLLGVVDADAAGAPARVLWAGDVELLPGRAGWDAGGGLAYTTATAGAVPAVADLWPPTGDGDQPLGEALDAALAGETTRLGGLLAPLGVQYVAVPLRLAPSDDTDRGPVGRGPTGALVATLAAQLDLQQVGVDRAMVLYRNTAFVPGEGDVPTRGAPGGTPARARALVVGQAALWLAAVVLALRLGAGPGERRPRDRRRHRVTPRPPAPGPGEEPAESEGPHDTTAALVPAGTGAPGR